MKHLIKFLSRKPFWDFIDNMLPSVIMNLGFLFLAAGESFLLLYSKNTILNISLSIFIGLIFSFYYGIVSLFAMEITDGERLKIKTLGKKLKKTIKPSLGFFLILLVMGIIGFFVVPFYFTLDNIWGAAGAGILSWVYLITFLSLPYYFPLAHRTAHGGISAFPAAVRLFFDNIIPSLILPFFYLGQIISSMITAFLLPGFSGFLLTADNAVKTFMIKYSFIADATEKKGSSKIPWETLLQDEDEKIGERSLLQTFFPPKDRGDD